MGGLYILLACLTSGLGSALVIPALIRLSERFDLLDHPNEHRKHHSKPIPHVGGLAILLGIGLAMLTYLIPLKHTPQGIIFLLLGILLLGGVGVRDDIASLAPAGKFMAQLIIASIVVILGEYRLQSLYGLLGIDMVPGAWAMILSIPFLLAFINAYNLIDGMDGLAGSLALVGLVFLGVWFLIFDNPLHATLALSTCAALLAFLVYNWHPARLFLGDTGSMILGLIIGCLVLEYLAMNKLRFEIGSDMTSGTPALAFATLIIPLTDLVRVFVTRLLAGRSPFAADNEHVHHLLQRTGRPTPRIVLFLTGVQIMVFGLSFLLKNEIHWLLITALNIVFSWICIWLFMRTGRTSSTLPEDI